MEGAPGLVGVMECGVGQLRCVKVSDICMVVNDHDCMCYLLYLLHRYCINEQPMICTAIECPRTPPITHGGMISYTTENTPNFALGTVATYSCITGYFLVVSEVRTCMDDNGMDAIGIWIGEPPTCVRKLE